MLCQVCGGELVPGKNHVHKTDFRSEYPSSFGVQGGGKAIAGYALRDALLTLALYAAFVGQTMKEVPKMKFRFVIRAGKDTFHASARGTCMLHALDVAILQNNIDRSKIVHIDTFQVPQFDFGTALQNLRAGLKVTREGWNGKGMFAFLVSGGTFQHEEMGEFPARPHFMLKTAQNDMAVWNPSTSDLLAEDWEVYTE